MGLLSNFKNWKMNRDLQQLNYAVNSTYQLMEHNNEIWLTCNGILVIPASMLNDDPVTILNKIRGLRFNELSK